MRTTKQIIGTGLLIMTFLLSYNVQGQRRTNNSNRIVKTERTVSNDRVKTNHHRHNDRYRTQPIRRSPHYRYPRHRRVIRTLPVNHVRIVYRGMPYFYYSGIYYTSYGDEYIVVLPPRGFRISVLPVGHVRIVVGPTVYFYHSGIYYVESTETNVEEEGKYEVTQPPVGTVVTEIHEDSEEVSVDGKTYYEYNDVLYKKRIDNEGDITYEVVYN
ncbi:DUF6515 family protein [Winogradskyella sp. 3972H.M.0a.05]|uniref:DUF6515 family protein n=1 Tax=Winogradskyella sp. 3972H.M.0a.05 TaxID=2950277 RepID=UPI00339A9CAE